MTLKVGVFGSDDSGRTTFTGLLYMAQIDCANRPGSGDGFRFYASPTQLRAIQGIYGQLRAGRWPTLPSQILRLSCSYLYSAKTGLLSKLIGGSKTSEVSVDVYMVDAGLLRGGDGNETVKRALSCDVFVLLVDAGRLSKNPLPEDATLASLLSRAAGGVDTPRDIVFILTRFDMLDRKTFDILDISPKPPQVGEVDARREYGEKFLARMCPKTLAYLHGSPFRPPAYFFSSVRVDFGEDGNLVPRLKKVKGQANVKLDYSFLEYKGLIMHLAEIAGNMKP